MEKKYIIAVVVALALWGVFMGFRHFNQQKQNQAHREDTYGRMIDMAKKSPRAGLYEMADAIKRYHADHKAYPSNLGVLYPQYMPSKAFIEQVDWSYTPDKDNFSLSKSTSYNNQTMVASIDSAMRPEVETGGVMVAGRRPASRKPVVREEETPGLVEAALSESIILEVVKEQEMTRKEVEVVTAAVSPEIGRAERPQPAAEKVNVQTELSRIITLVGAESVSAEEAQIGYNLERYMVWKDLNGAIGVSNVAFPDRTDMFVAVRNRWYNVKRRQPAGPSDTGAAQPAVVKEPKSAEDIVAGLSRDYLVWKSGEGGIGVGNTQYPDQARLMIASPGGWSELERPSVPEPFHGAGGEASEKRLAPDVDAIAADISRQYLVWKDGDGAIGIGDTQYPERERLEVASAEGWTVLASARPQAGSATRSSERKPSENEPDKDILAAGAGGQYLMWKDKSGKIGFSNIDYPELRDIAYVHSGGAWQKVVN